MLFYEIVNLQFPALYLFCEADEIGQDSFDDLKIVHSAQALFEQMQAELIPMMENEDEFFSHISEVTGTEIKSADDLNSSMNAAIIEAFQNINDEKMYGDNSFLFIKSIAQM